MVAIAVPMLGSLLIVMLPRPYAKSVSYTHLTLPTICSV